MITIDTPALGLGLFVGALLSGIFFATLAFSVRVALRSYRPSVVLLCSSVCRISLFLAAAYYLLITRGSIWCLVGFVIAFFLVRLVATAWAHPAVSTGRVKETV